MKRILPLFLLFLASCNPAGAQTADSLDTIPKKEMKGTPYGAKMILEGVYTGRNIYVQNPMSDLGGFCVALAPVVNGEVTTRLVKSPAFEIDLSKYNFSTGDKVRIEIVHDTGCVPKVLNPEALKIKE